MARGKPLTEDARVANLYPDTGLSALRNYGGDEVTIFDPDRVDTRQHWITIDAANAVPQGEWR